MDTTRVMHCLPEEQTVLEDALRRLRLLAAGEKLKELGLDPLRERLLERLDGKRMLRIACEEGTDRSQVAVLKDREEGEIAVFRHGFDLGAGRIESALFRELVRLCGGFVLDAEALQHHCFPGSGPRPGLEAFQLFAKRPVIDGLHAGRWVLWNPETGELFVRQAGGPGKRLAPVFQESAPGGEPPAVEREVGPAVEGGLEEVAPEPVPEPPVQPEVQVTAQPEVQVTAQPEVQVTAQPEVQVTAQPEVQVAAQPDWLATPLPVSALLGGIEVPPEAEELVEELLLLPPMTPGEWSAMLERMTQVLLTEALSRGGTSKTDEEGEEQP
ncbi:MAG: PT domain-containing protein [Bacillota bacterium]